MWSPPGKISIRVKREPTDSTGTSFPVLNESLLEEPVEISSSASPSSSSSSDDRPPKAEDETFQSNGSPSRELVLYNPVANGADEIEPEPEAIGYQPPLFPRYSPPNPPRVLPSIGSFTVQCASCFKWRLIPTKEKYEEIREHILEQPFLCKTAQEWRPDISCDDPADITQDGSRVWAIDKPNIAQPPPGWQRLLRIRGEGSTKFADVYYVAPSGKRFRSMVEIQKYLLEHPEYISGVTMAQFSFQIPKPLHENYVRKRPRLGTPCDGVGPLEPGEAAPLSWAGPDDDPADLQLGRRALPPQYSKSCLFDPVGQPAKKQAKGAPSNEIHSINPPRYN